MTNSTATKLKTFTIAKGTKAQITQAYTDGLIGATDFAIATDEDLNVVVESYLNGTEWYRVWSDGWCEQGGSGFTSDNYTLNKTITFLVPFKDTNYALEGVGFFIDSIGAQVTTSANKTATGFTTTSNTRTAGTNWWRACGYIK